jgi:hypothetical protein
MNGWRDCWSCSKVLGWDLVVWQRRLAAIISAGCSNTANSWRVCWHGIAAHFLRRYDGNQQFRRVQQHYEQLEKFLELQQAHCSKVVVVVVAILGSHG